MSNMNLKSRFKLREITKSLKMISITGVSQILIQGFGFLTGVYLIRVLDTKEYAYYTLANTMLGTMIILADGGITNGVLSEGGKVWGNQIRLGEVISTGLVLRKKFAFLSLLVSIPVLLYLLLQNGASFINSIIITGVTVFAFWVTLADSILEIAPKLYQKLFPLQKNQLKVNIARVFGSLITFFLPFSSLAILVVGVTRFWGNRSLKVLTYGLIPKVDVINREYEQNILKIVRKTLPTSIYYCISSQITIWIVSFFGQSATIASVGAIGRFSMIFTIVNEFFSILVVPRFARLEYSKNSLIRFFFTTQLVLIVSMALLLCFMSYFAEYFLWILGSKYSSLEYEFTLVISGGIINVLSQITNKMLASKSMIIKPGVFITYSIGVQIIIATLIDFKKLDQVLLYNVLSVLSIYAIRLFYFMINIPKLKDNTYS